MALRMVNLDELGENCNRRNFALLFVCVHGAMEFFICCLANFVIKAIITLDYFFSYLN